VKDPHVVSFRMSLWRWLLAVGFAGQISYAVLFVLMEILVGGGRGLRSTDFWAFYAAGAAMIAVLLAPALLAYVLIWKVRIGPASLRGSDFWGRFVTVTWTSVRAVQPFYLPLLPFLRVYSTETPRVIWLPLFLVNYRRFAELVAEYAGEDHPIAREVWQRLEEDE
jgi:hypothetical protein